MRQLLVARADYTIDQTWHAARLTALLAPFLAEAGDRELEGQAVG